MATDWIAQLERIRGSGGIASVLQRVLLLPIIAFGVTTANAVEATLSFFVEIPETLIGETTGLFSTIVGAVGGVVGAGGDTSAGAVTDFWILGLPISVVVILISGMAIAYYLERDETSDTIPFSFTDLPFLGTDEEED